MPHSALAPRARSSRSRSRLAPAPPYSLLCFLSLYYSPFPSGLVCLITLSCYSHLFFFNL